MEPWSFLLVAGVSLGAALLGALLKGSLFYRLRTLLALLAGAAAACFASEVLAAGTRWERWTGGLFLVLLALTATRTGLLLVFDHLLEKRLGVRLPGLTRDVVSAVVYLLVLLFAWQLATGTDLKAFLATSAVLTLVLGLALQDTLGMLFAGLALLGDKQLATGHWVEVDGVLGQVEALTWRALILRTRLGQRLVLPNTVVARSPLRIWRPQEPAAITVHLGTSYAENPARVRNVLQRVAVSIPEVCSQPTPQVLLAAFGESALQWECRLWTTCPERKADLTDLFLSRAWAALRREGVEIPFPQRVLHRAATKAEIKQVEAVRAALQACPTLSSLPADSLQALAHNSRLVSFADGELLLLEGETSRALYVVAAGQAKVLKQGQEVALLGEGELFGEIAFLTGEPRVASVMALGELAVVEVDERGLRQALQEQPSLAEELAQRVASRTAELARLQELTTSQKPRELAHTLVQRLRRLLRGQA